jgi:hypothetical protein
MFLNVILESGKIKLRMELLLMRVVKRPTRDQEDIYIKCSFIGGVRS